MAIVDRLPLSDIERSSSSVGEEEEDYEEVEEVSPTDLTGSLEQLNLLSESIAHQQTQITTLREYVDDFRVKFLTFQKDLLVRLSSQDNPENLVSFIQDHTRSLEKLEPPPVDEDLKKS